MRIARLGLGLLVLVGLAGCDVAGMAIDSKGGGPQLEIDQVRIDREALTSNLSLMSQESSIRIGQDLNMVLVGGYRRPKRGVTLRELPPEVSSDFVGLGWETTERTVSLVAKESDVVMALDMENSVTMEHRDEVVSKYQFIYGDPSATVGDQRASYWFWEKGPVRVMICSVRIGEGTFRLTSVLGLGTVMDRLRMDADSARQDVGAAAQIAAENPVK
ncbi:MAG: hypothetical protein ACKVQS_07580 [Fimbriimonadaceae bacterium]